MLTEWIRVPAKVVERIPQSRRSISAPIAGRITKVYVAQGQAVRAGAKLFELRGKEAHTMIVGHVPDISAGGRVVQKWCYLPIDSQINACIGNAIGKPAGNGKPGSGWRKDGEICYKSVKIVDKNCKEITPTDQEKQDEDEAKEERKVKWEKWAGKFWKKCEPKDKTNADRFDPKCCETNEDYLAPEKPKKKKSLMSTLTRLPNRLQKKSRKVKTRVAKMVVNLSQLKRKSIEIL